MAVPAQDTPPEANRPKTLADRARAFAQTKSSWSILEFAESPRGLNIKLLPAQRFFLKVFEKENLDDTDAYIPIRDQFNERILSTVTERGFYQYLRDQRRFSLDYELYQANPVVQINLCMGRRASKTTIIAVWLAYKLYQILNHDHPQLWFGILPTDPMNIMMTALGEDNAARLFKRLVALLQASAFFKPHLLEAATTQEVKIWTHHDRAQLANPNKPTLHSNSIAVMAASNGPGVRGENNMFIVADEYAHFNNSAQSTRDKPMDVMIYEALVPSTSGFRIPAAANDDGEVPIGPDGSPLRVPFGKSLFISSPNGKQGKFFKDFEQAVELGIESFTLAIQAATWEVNPTVDAAFLRKEYNKNPVSYDQEYGGKFLAGGVNWLQDMSSFYTSFDKRLNPLQPTGRRERVYFLGIDFALANDGTACSICHWEPYYEETVESFPQDAFSFWTDPRLTDPSDPHFGDKDFYDLRNPEYFESLERPKGRFVVDYSEVRQVGKGKYAHHKVLPIDDMLDWVEDLYFRWPIKAGIFDQWSGDIIQQMVEKRGLARRLEMVKFTTSSNDSMYKLFSSVLHQQQLKMPADITLINELLALQVELKPHGQIKIEAPAARGHDDRFDSIIRALFLAYSFHNKNLVLGTQSLQALLFNNVDPVRTSGSFTGTQSEKHYRNLQQMYHQTGDSLRQAAGRGGGFNRNMMPRPRR